MLTTDDDVLALSDEEFFAEIARGFDRLRADPETWREYNEVADAFAAKSIGEADDLGKYARGA